MRTLLAPVPSAVEAATVNPHSVTPRKGAAIVAVTFPNGSTVTIATDPRSTLVMLIRDVWSAPATVGDSHPLHRWLRMALVGRLAAVTRTAAPAAPVGFDPFDLSDVCDVALEAAAECSEAL